MIDEPMRYIQWRTVLGEDSAALLATRPVTSRPTCDQPIRLAEEHRELSLDELRVLYPRERK